MTGPERPPEPEPFDEESDSIGVGSEESAPGRMLGLVLMVAMLVLGVGAAVVLVVAEDARWLRFGVVAALWAALAGAFAATRFRRQAQLTDARVAGLRDVYELELEREVAARQEYELEIEVETRRKVEAEVSARSTRDMDALRAELRVLRENLAALLGGEVLVERVALRAESTRMRSMPPPNGAPKMIEVSPDRSAHPVWSSERHAARPPGRTGDARPAAMTAEEATQVHLELVNGFAEPARPVAAETRYPGHAGSRAETSQPRFEVPPPVGQGDAGRRVPGAGPAPLADFGPGRPSGGRPPVDHRDPRLIPSVEPAVDPPGVRPAGGPLDDPGRLRPVGGPSGVEEPRAVDTGFGSPGVDGGFGPTDRVNGFATTDRVTDPAGSGDDRARGASPGRGGAHGHAGGEAGAHTAGRSVSELLAAYAAEEGSRRRSRHQA